MAQEKELPKQSMVIMKEYYKFLDEDHYSSQSLAMDDIVQIFEDHFDQPPDEPLTDTDISCIAEDNGEIAFRITVRIEQL